VAESGETIRTHVVLPRELVEAVDQIVGSRRRSQYVEEALIERVKRDQQRRVLREMAETGSVLSDEVYPYWSTPERTSAWVRQLRREADERAMRKRAGTADDGTTSA
jgi:hypothetical protein